MISSRRPPTFMPATPWSQPGITCCAPIWNGNGFLPRSHDASNCLPVLQATPTYWTLTLSPAFAALPLPTTTSFDCSSVGGSPVGFGIVGFLVVSLSDAGSVTLPGFPVEAGAGVGGAPASPPLGAADVLVSLPPQPAAPTVTASAAP